MYSELARFTKRYVGLSQKDVESPLNIPAKWGDGGSTDCIIVRCIASASTSITRADNLWDSYMKYL